MGIGVGEEEVGVEVGVGERLELVKRLELRLVLVRGWSW
jgi:hypothetical protein